MIVNRQIRLESNSPCWGVPMNRKELVTDEPPNGPRLARRSRPDGNAGPVPERRRAHPRRGGHSHRLGARDRHCADGTVARGRTAGAVRRTQRRTWSTSRALPARRGIRRPPGRGLGRDRHAAGTLRPGRKNPGHRLARQRDRRRPGRGARHRAPGVEGADARLEGHPALGRRDRAARSGRVPAWSCGRPADHDRLGRLRGQRGDQRLVRHGRPCRERRERSCRR